MLTSHLCGTKGWLRDSHLLIESNINNKDRRACPDVILALKFTGPSIPKQIIQFKPCVLGINHPEAQGDFLKFTCRKIEVLIQDEVSTKYYRSLC
ncbi:unnamed protein product [Adineta steineri]|uniref:Zinc-binding loop region of homing endonuclease domain-containing protein n=1 Tax=Adineta steineri TaxID=433720 RepID=A0A818N8N7_9BILA|nr:unnamed protein product [Adineta steineri]CAF3602644.1 unnamed protein product [Adineta steineri]